MNIEHEATFNEVLKLFEDTPSLVVEREDKYLECVKHLPSGWKFFTGTNAIAAFYRESFTVYPGLFRVLFDSTSSIRIQKQILKYRNEHQTPI